MREILKNKNGITLITLVVTIIILLILAGVSMATLTGDNGLLRKAGEAKEQTEIVEQKEIIEIATIQAMAKDRNGEIEKEILEEELTKALKNNNYEIINVGKKSYIIIVNNAQYEIKEDGTVQNGSKVVESNIKNAGDLTKGGQYDGETEETSYRIECIEDLVEWSNNYKIYLDKNIKLGKALDFNNIADYDNYKKVTLDINMNGINEPLISELTTGSGFKPITTFNGVFNGEGNNIKNIYINVDGNAGLFANMNGKICNLSISGNIISKQNHAGGFSASGGYGDGTYINLHNKATIKSLNKSAGGILGTTEGNADIYNCYNSGNILSEAKKSWISRKSRRNNWYAREWNY